jgi:hypothetical protein
MTRLSLHPRRSRLGTAVALALMGVFATTRDAFACWDHCVDVYGSTFRVGDSQIWELKSCTEYFNGGGITTICYYKVYMIDAI